MKMCWEKDMCIQAFCNVTMDFALGNLIKVPLVKSRTSPPRNKHRQNERKSPLKMRIFFSCHLSSSLQSCTAAQHFLKKNCINEVYGTGSCLFYFPTIRCH